MEKLPAFFTRANLGKSGGETYFKKAYYRKKFYAQKLLSGLDEALIPIFEIDSGSESEFEPDFIEPDEPDRAAEILDNSDEKVVVKETSAPDPPEPISDSSPSPPEAEPEELESEEFDPEKDLPDYAEIVSVLREFKEAGFTCGMVSEDDPETGSRVLYVRIE